MTSDAMNAVFGYMLGQGPLSGCRAWHMARCAECGPPPLPFADANQRDVWAEAHAGSTGHTVTRYEDRQERYMRRGVQHG